MTNEIVPGLIRTEEIDGKRLLCQFLLYSDDHLTIVDAREPDVAGSGTMQASQHLARPRIDALHLDHRFLLTSFRLWATGHRDVADAQPRSSVR